MMEQYRFDKEYLTAAKLAFDSNYTQFFMQVVQEMIGGLSEDRTVEMDEEGNIVEQPQQMDIEETYVNITDLVKHACETDINRFLVMILTMNSTVKHYKSGNRLFVEVLRQRKLKGLQSLNRHFTLPQKKEEMEMK